MVILEMDPKDLLVWAPAIEEAMAVRASLITVVAARAEAPADLLTLPE